MSRYLVIYNPVAGSRQEENFTENIRHILSHNRIPFDWYETTSDNRTFFDGSDLTQYERVVVAGGDGTVHEVASVLVLRNLSIPLILIPLGSANLLATALGLDITDKVVNLQLSFQWKPRRFHVLRVNQKYVSLISSSIGYLTLVADYANRDLKRRVGFVAYFIAILRTFFGYPSRKFTIIIDQNTREERAKLVSVFNTQIFRRLPFASKHRTHGRSAEIGIFYPHSISHGIQLLIRLFRSRKMIQEEHIKLFRGNYFKISSPNTRHIDIDGEKIEADHLEIFTQRNALSFVVP